jgi:hypothetical protein
MITIILILANFFKNSKALILINFTMKIKNKIMTGPSTIAAEIRNLLNAHTIYGKLTAVLPNRSGKAGKMSHNGASFHNRALFYVGML